MKVDNRFFVWDEAHNALDVKLGDDINELLRSKTILNTGSEAEPEYKISNNKNVWVGAKNNEVAYLYFTYDAGAKFFDKHPDDFDGLSLEQMSAELSEKYEVLSYQDMDEVKAHYKGDLMYIIYRDDMLYSTFLIRLKGE